MHEIVVVRTDRPPAITTIVVERKETRRELLLHDDLVTRDVIKLALSNDITRPACGPSGIRYLSLCRAVHARSKRARQPSGDGPGADLLAAGDLYIRLIALQNVIPGTVLFIRTTLTAPSSRRSRRVPSAVRPGRGLRRRRRRPKGSIMPCIVNQSSDFAR